MSLSTITGKIKNLSISTSGEDILLSKENDKLGVPAIGAAAIGEVFAATAINSGTAGADIPIDHFTCQVNELEVAGKFHKIGFCEGEIIEFVVEDSCSPLIAYAARSEARRILWMPPYECRGYVAQRHADIFWSLITGIFTLVFALWFDLEVGPHIPKPLSYYASIYGGCFVIGFALTTFVTRWRMLYDFSEHATDVLFALGYPHPEDVSLPKLHRKATSELRRKTNVRQPFLEEGWFRY